MNGGSSIVTTRQIALQVKGVLPPAVAILHLHIEEHVEGSRYCQVYRIKPVNNDAIFVGLIPTAVYCLKVYHVPVCRFCPPDSFLFTTLPRRRLIKNLDRLARIGALWEFIARTAAAHEMGLPNAVPNVFATFYDQNLLAFGIIEEWVGGRPWRLEMDDCIFDRIAPDEPVDYLHPQNFPNEYTAKRFFLARMERLLREMGAEQLAKRYRWDNWLSTRRVVLRSGAQDVYRDLTALDFEPALGSSQKLQAYVEQHADWFAPARLAVMELVSLLEDVASDREKAPVMPRANPGAGQLLWHWSSSNPSRTLVQKMVTFSRRAVQHAHIMARLARHPPLREAWLLEKVEEGVLAGQLSEAEAARIRAQAADPDVQLYLHCLFVHICMLPVTPIVVLLGAALYDLWHGLGLAESIRIITTWLAVFAVVPLSPGSLARGLYVVGVVVRRKMARRLKVALFLSFWRYVGYLAFPLQMAATFPALSRFMAAQWATHAVHHIPYYGAPGGRLEHMVFDLFFNLPLSWARRRGERKSAAMI